MGFFTIALPSAIFIVCGDSSSGQIYAWAAPECGTAVCQCSLCDSRRGYQSCRPDRSSSADATKMNPVTLYSVFVPTVLLVCWDSGGSMVTAVGQYIVEAWQLRGGFY